MVINSRSDSMLGSRVKSLDIWSARSYILVAPLFFFLIATFLAPVFFMLSRAVVDRELENVLPDSAVALRNWNGAGVPPDWIAATVAREIKAARRAGTINRLANRLNYAEVGSRSLIFATATSLQDGARADGVADLAAIDRRWQREEIWAAMRHSDGPLTSHYLLAALDRRLNVHDQITKVPQEQAVFADIYLRTFKISAIVALFCIILGYPVAYFLASLPKRKSNLLLILVLLPFWTSTLVRTAAWAVLLQTNGVINRTLESLGLVDSPVQLIYNRVGVYIAMTHVLLPFFILPLYGVMKGLSSVTMQAASSLGARPLRAFLSVYLPLTLPGVFAGAIIVFTLALGYYVTPALVGGGADQMISASIAFYTNQSLNWGMAAALSVILLTPVILVALAGQVILRRMPG